MMEAEKEIKPPPYTFSRGVEAKFSEEHPETGLYPYLHILRTRKRTLFVCILFTLSMAVFANLTQRPVYQASAELILEPRESKTNTSTQAGANLMTDPTFLITQQRLVRGPRLAEKVLKKLEQPENRESLLNCFGIRPSRKRKDPGIFSEKERRALIGAIQRSVSLRQLERGARIFAISISGYAPAIVARLADATAASYNELNYEAHIDAFRQNFSMVSKSLTEARERIKTGEMASQKINSEIRLLEALKVYEEKHPLVIELRTEIPQLTQKLRQGVRDLEKMEISQRKDLRPLLLEPHTQLEDLQRNETDLYTLKPLLEQELNSNKEMYNSIFKKFQEIELSGGGSVWMEADIVEPASVPGKPIRPNKKLNLLLGFFTGLFLGVGLAFLQEYLDSSVRSLEDIRSYLKFFPLGMVPFVERSVKDGSALAEPKDKELARILWLSSDSDIPLYVSEAYRIVRTNLAFGSVDQSLKTLQVTSAVKGEGKTTTAANLAISFALTGYRTLIVDADMRRPTLHRLLGVEAIGVGLSDALTNGTSWESCAIPTPTPHLYFMSAGTIPPNPAELLSSKRMKALVEELGKNFDIVIFDSPPVISVADSAILASRVDGTIFVSRAGFIPRHLCLQAKVALESVKAKVIGCVLNGVHDENQPYYYHQYSREYARYGETKSSKEKSKGTLEFPDTFERLKVLKEPFLVSLSANWNRLMERLKWESSKKESKSSVDAP